MLILDSVTCGDDFTAVATISDLWRSNGGYLAIAGNDVYAQLQHGDQGLSVWTDAVHLPVGNGSLEKGTTGIRFKNYRAGQAAIVSAGLSGPKEPPITIGAGGVATPASGVSPFSITRSALAANVLPASATDTTVLTVPVTMPASGGPFRVLANWSQMVFLGGAVGVMQGWVDDQAGGSPIFADVQGAVETASSSSGFAASAFSQNTYANGVTITFLLRFRIAGAANVVKAAPAAGTHGETYLELAVFAAA